MITASLFTSLHLNVFSQSVENSSCHPIILWSMLFLGASTPLLPLYLTCIIYSFCQYFCNTSVQEIIKTWIQEAHVLFQGNSVCKDSLSLGLKSDKGSSLGGRQYSVLFNPSCHLCMTKPFPGTSFIITDQETGPVRKDNPLARALN